MKLLAGQRIKLIEAGRALLVKQGRIEAYALMEEGSHRLFLMELKPGEAAFHSADEFGEITIEVYAMEEAELEELSLAEAQASILLPLMRHWFRELICLPWLRLMADLGDEILKTWADGSVLGQSGQQPENLLQEFEKNQGIFSMLAGVRFASQDKRLARRLKERRKHKRRLLDETLGNLLGEDWVSVSDSSGQGNAKLEETVFLVRAVAHHLGMPEEDIALNKETAKKLDALGVLRRLVAKGGMEMRLIRLEKGWEGWDCGAMLGYFGEQKQLAALLPVSPSSYRLVTGDNMEGVLLTSEMARLVSGDAFLVYPGLPDRKLRRRDFLRFMVRHTWQTDWKSLILAGLFMGHIPLLTPIVTETMFQDLIPILDRKGLATVTQVVLVAGFTTAALSTVRSLAVLRLTSLGTLRGQAALMGRLLKLPPGFFRRFQSGELAERMQGLDRAAMLLTSESVGALLSFACSFWSLGLMCYYSVKLTGIALLVWLTYLAVSALLLYKLTGAQRDMTEAGNKTSGILAQIFAGLAKFRTKGTEEQAYHLWGRQFAIELGNNIRVRRLKNISTVIAAMQPMLLTLILYYNGLLELAASQSGGAAAEALGLGTRSMTAATFIAFQSAFTAFNTSLVAIMPILESMTVIKPYFDNLRPILEEEPETSEEKQEAGALSGAIEVRNLTFGYLPDSKVLDDVSFRIAAGEQVAIVGKSGCGKSTLVRLLLGFELPRQGAVYYDGQDLSELSLPSVRSQMGVVLQNGQLMSGDILHNIIGTNNLTLEDAWAAAEAAGIAEDIRQMPMQMHTIVSEGSSNISGGQRQRILIARALALKPSIIVCDEATSALDNRTQAIVTRSLDKLHATRIIVAHRLSTIRHADRIIVLDKGRIAETGSFQELVEKGGIFASFVRRQVA